MNLRRILASSAALLLLTMTSRADKLWPEARWIDVGRALALPAVLPWGSDEERRRAERIARGIGEAVVPARMALAELAPVLGHARAVIGLDSGLTHLAAALGVPAVAIFCGSDPALTGLYGAARAANGADRPAPWPVPLYLAHGLGIGGVEPPFVGTDLGLAAEERVVLEPGMVLVLEPYAWEEGLGGYRAEQTIVVTASGTERLSASPP